MEFQKGNRVDFFRHGLGERELVSVAQVLEKSILTTGEEVDRFENRFAGYLGRRHAVGVTSCTGALHLSLLAVGIKPGDEVITTPMSFVATSTAILQAGGKPVFVDVQPDTGSIDPSCIESAITERTRAIVPVHLYGQMCDMKAIREIADRHRLYVVEDAAHCIEGERDGIRPGQLGDAACFSFYATKSITCGEGGAVVTDDSALAKTVRLSRLHGITRTAAEHLKEGYQLSDMVMLGYKYNMNNIQAALLLPQMDGLDVNLQRRQSLVRRYEENLSGITSLSWPQTMAGVRHARHLFTVWVGDGLRDSLMNYLQAEGIGLAVNYRPMHLFTFFRESFGFRQGDFPNAECIGGATLSLPLFSIMPEKDVDTVVETIRHFFAERRT